LAVADAATAARPTVVVFVFFIKYQRELQFRVLIQKKKKKKTIKKEFRKGR